MTIAGPLIPDPAHLHPPRSSRIPRTRTRPAPLIPDPAHPRPARLIPDPAHPHPASLIPDPAHPRPARLKIFGYRSNVDIL